MGPKLSLEQAILPCSALATEEEIRLAACAGYGGAVIEDRMELRAGRCEFRGEADEHAPATAGVGTDPVLNREVEVILKRRLRSKSKSDGKRG